MLLAFLLAACSLGCFAAEITQVEFSLVYHDKDLDVLAAVRYAYNQLQSNEAPLFLEVPADFDSPFEAGKQICQLLEEKKLVILIGYRFEHIALLRSYSREFQVPLVLLDTGLDRPDDLMEIYKASPAISDETGSSPESSQAALEEPSPYEIQFGVPYAPPVYEVIQHNSWDSFSVVYDTEDGLRRASSLIRRFSKAKKVGNINILRMFHGLEADAARQLSFYHKDLSHVLIDVRNSASLRNFEKALQSNRALLRQTDFLLARLNFDVESSLGPTMRKAKLTGFDIASRINRSESFANKDYVEKVVKDWENLDPIVYPLAGEGRITANQAFAVDFVTALVNTLKQWRNSDPTSFAKLQTAATQSQTLEKGCLGRAVSNCATGPEIVQRMKSTKTPKEQTLTGRLEFNEQGERVDYEIGYYGQENLRVGFRSLGKYRDTTGFGYFPASEERGKSSYANRTLIITTIKNPPYLQLKMDSNFRTGNDRFEGYVADLAEAIAEVADFKYVLRLVGDNSYGSVNSNGEWNGMVGEVVNGEADMAIAPLIITERREKVLDFTKPFMTFGYAIMMKKPPIPKDVTTMFNVLQPFSLELWICIVLAYIAVSTVLFLVTRLSPYEWHEHSRHEPTSSERAPKPAEAHEKVHCSHPEACYSPVNDNSQSRCRLGHKTYVNDFTFLNALWFMLGAFMRQDVVIAPRSLSGRIVGSVWWFFTIIIVFAYTANLAIYLTVERMTTPIESVEDLAKQSHIKYGTFEYGATAYFFKTSNHELYQKMWTTMSTSEPSVFVRSADEGIERVRQGQYAFILESTMIDYVNSRNPCNTMKVGGNLNSVGYGIALAKGSDLKDDVNIAVLVLAEQNRLALLQKKWWVDKSECETRYDTADESIGDTGLPVSNVAGVFSLLLSGLILALMVCICEFGISKLKPKPSTTATRTFTWNVDENTPLREPEPVE